MDHEVALALVALIQVLFGVYFEHIVAHLEPNRLNLLGNVLARLFDVAESLVSLAVKLGESSLPLTLDFVENIGRNRKLGASSIDNSGIAHIFTRLLHCLSSVGHSLAFKCPCSKPVGEVLERLESLLVVNNLGRVVATKESVGSLTHLLGGHTEADNSVVDNTVVLERP